VTCDDAGNAPPLECIGGPWDGQFHAPAPGEATIVLVRGPIGFAIDRPDGRRATYLPAPAIVGRYRRHYAPDRLEWEPFE
jgi:hypothetical protein